MARLYIEGGGDRDATQKSCRAAFSELFKNAVFSNLRLVACGGRDQAFKRFSTATRSNTTEEWIGLLVDSEDPVSDIEKTWKHLKQRDNWDKPTETTVDEDVLLMVTCMESWIIVDHPALKSHYGQFLQESALPSLFDNEKRARDDIQEALQAASKKSPKRYEKGKRSFLLLEQVDPETLKKHCPSFARCCRIPGEKL